MFSRSQENWRMFGLKQSCWKNSWPVRGWLSATWRRCSPPIGRRSFKPTWQPVRESQSWRSSVIGWPWPTAKRKQKQFNSLALSFQLEWNVFLFKWLICLRVCGCTQCGAFQGGVPAPQPSLSAADRDGHPEKTVDHWALWTVSYTAVGINTDADFSILLRKQII